MLPQHLESLQDDASGYEGEHAGTNEFSEYIQQKQAESRPEKIVIDGEEYTPDSIKELVSKGKDYTKKTQELSQQKREIEERLSAAERDRQEAEIFRQMNTLAETNPQEFYRQLEQRIPRSPDGRFARHEIDVETLTSNEQALLEQNNELREQLRAMTKTHARFETVAAIAETTHKASLAADAVKEKYGVDISAAKLTALAEKHKVAPEQAFILEYHEDLSKSSFKAGEKAKELKASAPNTPVPKQGVKGVIPYSDWANKKDPWSTDKIQRFLQQGYEMEGPPKR